MAELIEMPFLSWTLMGPRNHVLGGGVDPPGKGHFCGLFLLLKFMYIVTARSLRTVT